ncbi:MAG TPA: DUF2062 domain-containing protein [Steroidobacteraceae bacterium]|nr:DUF2062 domain-containing protein [Steroidobacteraceae bacterium]
MPRRFFKKIAPRPHTLRERWYFRPFAARLADPRLWSLQRRSVTGAVGAGLAICFVPLPVHLPLAALVGVACRVNVPAIVATVFLVNPFTFVPVYYFAYRVGTTLLGLPPQRFELAFSWEALQNGLAPNWQPLLVGCVACAVTAGLVGWAALELIWRWSVNSRYRARRPRSTD